MVALNATQFYSADQIIESVTGNMKTSLDAAVDGSYRSFLPANNQQQTEISEDDRSFHVITSETEHIVQKEAIEVSKPRKNQANGTVLEVDEVSVKCEVYSNHQNRIINLSKTLFKDRVTIGMPFMVVLDETSGYKRLLIKDREINEEIRQQGNEEMAALINEL